MELGTDLDEQPTAQRDNEQGAIWGYDLMTCISLEKGQQSLQNQSNNIDKNCKESCTSNLDSGLKWMNSVQRAAMCSSNARVSTTQHDYQVKIEELSKLLTYDTSQTHYLA